MPANEAYSDFIGTVAPTPTYDPFIEPPLPEDPTDTELGRNLYWHHCMPCHGDRGQGLTDEFRAIWEPDHQNCWARGCHSGRWASDSFPIPTTIPHVVGDDRLADFPSIQSLQDYLKATHPPQNPGFLKDSQYHALALFLFDLNDRPLMDSPSTPTPTATATPDLPLVTQTCPPELLMALSLVFIALVIAITHTRRKPV